MNNFNRIFGSGPLGLFISLVLLFVLKYLKNKLNTPEIFDDNQPLRIIIFALLTLTCVILIIWSGKSLNPQERGKTLVTTGAFNYFRHPLYAAFLTFFNFGLAVLLNNWIYIFWAVILHPIWHFLVMREEKMLKTVFPVEYEQYCKRTGRFFPKLIIKK